jgi:hypothetical protein
MATVAREILASAVKRSQESAMRFLRFDTEAWAHSWRIGYDNQGTNYLPRILLRYAAASTVTQHISSASPCCPRRRQSGWTATNAGHRPSQELTDLVPLHGG